MKIRYLFFAFLLLFLFFLSAANAKTNNLVQSEEALKSDVNKLLPDLVIEDGQEKIKGYIVALKDAPVAVYEKKIKKEAKLNEDPKTAISQIKFSDVNRFVAEYRQNLQGKRENVKNKIKSKVKKKTASGNAINEYDFIIRE